MIEGRQRPRLVGKAARDVGVVAERPVQQLDRDVPAKARVVSAVDRAHAALTEPAGDLEYTDAIALDQRSGRRPGDILVAPANGSRHFRELSGGGVCLEERRHLAVQIGVLTTQPPEQRRAPLLVALQNLMKYALHVLPVHGAHTLSSRQRNERALIRCAHCRTSATTGVAVGTRRCTVGPWAADRLTLGGASMR